jgi:hypothetical protein
MPQRPGPTTLETTVASAEEAATASAFATLSLPLTPTRTIGLDADPTVDDPVAAKRAELRHYFHQTCEIYERLFALIRDDASYYPRHEPLRHPLIFYYAHPAVFYLNKLTAGRYVSARLDPVLEAMMAVGVDEMSWDDLNTAHYDWPSAATVKRYRAAMRRLVDDFIQTMPLELPIRWNSPAWMILMGIEHERIHLETSSVLIRQQRLDLVRTDPAWAPCRETAEPPPNQLLPVPAGTVRLGQDQASAPWYGWDNEYGTHEAEVPAFAAARMSSSLAPSRP